ncbi:hypothetical protein RJ639_013729 [Escallonia herrerae]|uniref:Reverse transcriptase/retrotransposon-derived protein RNase H-like domain-containing protein n=1 Tax=Escallonia herrerae TaxID=1293975 RepID=A0AA88VI04_9ASTE|nr:hypothetical protein RJ639_013729 [Escallonia herrerae]
MNISMDRLQKTDTPLYGFSSHLVVLEGSGVNLTPQNEVPHRTQDWRGERKPDYNSSVLHDFMSIEEQRSTHYIEDLREDTKMQRGEPAEDLVSIEVYPGVEKKTVQIGSNLKKDTKLELVNLLRTYADVFTWTAANMPRIDPEKSFKELKTYLKFSPLLSKPLPREDLFLYLSITEVAISAVLVREDDGVQKTIYYVSKALQDVETTYPKIDKIVDTLSRLAFAKITDVRRSVYLEFLNDRSINSQAEVGMIDQGPCWVDMIIKYLFKGKLPSERHEARNLRVKAARYALVEGVLYKKSFSLPYLRCLRPSESLYALQEGHEGICGQHLGGRTLAQNILRQGYYWPTMHKETIEFTRRSEICPSIAYTGRPFDFGYFSNPFCNMGNGYVRTFCSGVWTTKICDYGNRLLY